jgi:hypothetical protein
VARPLGYQRGVSRANPRFFFSALLVLLFAGCAGTDVGPRGGQRDVYVLISGGGTPLSNNYSQYLQAKAFADAFARSQPADATWVFFGSGNRDDAPPALADVRRVVKRDGVLVESWLPGVIRGNRPATKESILRTLREEILPAVRNGGTLHLIVGDHGELAGKGEAEESAITLWQLKRSTQGGWRTDKSEVLRVSELRAVLLDGIGRGRVVFGMTQCHSGGFHELAVAREMAPYRAWFTTPPEGLTGPRPGLRLAAAGFTATDQASLAAGCDPDPDPERWAGYERFLPERLLGLDLMTGQPLPAHASLASAHEAATLIDRTIDKPRATTDHYLEAWARVIEERVARTLALTPRAQRAVTEFETTLETGRVVATDPALRERQALFERFEQRLIADLPANAPAVNRLGRRELLTAGESRRGGGREGGGRRGAAGEARQAWTDTLRPAWKQAVLAGQVPGLNGATLEFERRLLKLEDDGRSLLFGRGGEGGMLNEIFWRSSYAEPATFDAARAAAVTTWGAVRRDRIVAWGKQSAEAGVRAAAEKVGPWPAYADTPPRPLSRHTAAERVWLHRRVLAAWQFLLAMDAQPALAELKQLLALERTEFTLQTRTLQPLKDAGSALSSTH